jgi:hypothetical protein
MQPAIVKVTITNMGSTKVELVEDLAELIKANGGHPKAYLLGDIMAAAQKGTYHDFESELATPKIQLVRDLTGISGTEQIINKVKNGDYDEPPTEEQSRQLDELLKQ